MQVRHSVAKDFDICVETQVVRSRPAESCAFCSLSCLGSVEGGVGSGGIHHGTSLGNYTLKILTFPAGDSGPVDQWTVYCCCSPIPTRTMRRSSLTA